MPSKSDSQVELSHRSLGKDHLIVPQIEPADVDTPDREVQYPQGLRRIILCVALGLSIVLAALVCRQPVSEYDHIGPRS